MTISMPRMHIAILALAVFVCLAPAAQAGPTKWEYLVVSAGLNNRSLEQMLDARGAEGWELVAFTRKDVAVFKRKVQ